jgi:hypothetical protein
MAQSSEQQQQQHHNHNSSHHTHEYWQQLQVWSLGTQRICDMEKG